MLDRHLTGCAACREWEVSVLSSTALLREAPLEVSARHFELSRSRSRLSARRALAVAAVVAVVAVASVLGVFLSDRGGASPEPPSPQLSLLPGGPSQLGKPSPPTGRPGFKRPDPKDDTV